MEQEGDVMEQLHLGVARKVITPEIGCQLMGYRPDVFSHSVEDELTATAFYFKQGSTQSLMISLTICAIKTELAQNILGYIEWCFFKHDEFQIIIYSNIYSASFFYLFLLIL